MSSSIIKSVTKKDLCSNCTGQACGKTWKNSLYFDPQSDKRQGFDFFLTQEQLTDKLSEAIGQNQMIEEIQIYKTPLSEHQLTNLFFHHQYVCFGTEKWWWSLQKNDQGLTMQRSNKKKYVYEYYRQTLRCKTAYWSPQLIEKDQAQYSLKELMQWIAGKNMLADNYHLTQSNCKHFANEIFNECRKKRKN